MKNLVTLLVAFIMPLTWAGGALSNLTAQEEPTGTIYRVEYLSPNESLVRSRSASNTIQLDTDFDAYVVNKTALLQLESESASNYLAEGGVIIVNDKDATYDDLYESTNIRAANFDTSDIDRFGFYILGNEKSSIVVEVTLGYIGTSDTNKTNLNTANIPTENIVEAILNDLPTKSRAFNNQFVEEDFDGGSGVSPQSSLKTGLIAIGILENILFLEKNDQKACSYTISTEIYSVAKIQQSNGIVRGIYDVISTVTVDAEPNFYVTDYEVRMRNTDSIAEASFLQSSTSTTVSFGANFGVQGSTIAGGASYGISYTYSSTSQTLTNNLPAGSNKYWKSSVPNKLYDASFQLKPAIRIVNSSDSLFTYQYSRVESFYIKENKLFDKAYYMEDKYRKELQIRWDSAGNYVLQTNVG